MAHLYRALTQAPLALTSVEKGLSLAYYINCLEQWGTITAGGTAAASYLVVLTLAGQRMVIRLMRLDGDDSRAQYIEAYIVICLLR